MRVKPVLLKNTTQCPRPGPEPGPLDPESSTVTMRPPRLPLKLPRTLAQLLSVRTTLVLLPIFVQNSFDFCSKKVDQMLKPFN